MTDPKIPRGFRFNRDEKWQAFVANKYADLISRIAFKYCSADEDLRQDLEQEALIALMTVDPTEIKDYDLYAAGILSEEQWAKRLDTYLRQVIRNSVLAPLQTTATGNWRTGRKKRRRNPVTGKNEYIPSPAPYVSLDAMLEAGVQIDMAANLFLPEKPSYSRRGSDPDTAWGQDVEEGRANESDT